MLIQIYHLTLCFQIVASQFEQFVREKTIQFLLFPRVCFHFKTLETCALAVVICASNIVSLSSNVLLKYAIKRYISRKKYGAHVWKDIYYNVCENTVHLYKKKRTKKYGAFHIKVASYLQFLIFLQLCNVCENQVIKIINKDLYLYFHCVIKNTKVIVIMYIKEYSNQLMHCIVINILRFYSTSNVQGGV